MSPQEIVEYLEGEEALLLEPRADYDSCLIGIGCRFNSGPLAVYDVDKVLVVLEKSMDEDDAIDYFQVNILGSWLGDGTPFFVKIE